MPDLGSLEGEIKLAKVGGRRVKLMEENESDCKNDVNLLKQVFG